ncbi:Glyoxylase, beta-lactamase superfamily II [Devosia enhydra]|uniref:Glyoxylase, beta-lactamase superfamily II n=1 Tax=Devosia enhydra TaxID=665118 RepID=A0A1K2I3A2_9HYPH|nr:MBL fold metallo-hydrolase [Devosia enhydra]SFZ86236.1 Glyoxylase, beta-lactamase superfamily II [Devosia enhydra]
MAFLTEPEPSRGVFEAVAPGVSRMVAANPGLMTYHGTNTYLIKTDGGRFILDPGPAQDRQHLDVIARLEDVAGIIVSHHHADHFGAVEALRAVTGLPVYAFERFADDAFLPDILLRDGDRVGGLEVLHTPGHASDHLCLARNDGLLFSGDHVMGWNSSIVPLPDGDMGDYCRNLTRLLERDDRLYLPGHGPAIIDPQPHVRRLLDHRLKREAEILSAIASQPQAPADLSRRLYDKADPHLARAALRNVEAHLKKLEGEGRARREGDIWRAL